MTIVSHARNRRATAGQISLFGLGVALGFLGDFRNLSKLKLLLLSIISHFSGDLQPTYYDLSRPNFTINTSVSIAQKMLLPRDCPIISRHECYNKFVADSVSSFKFPAGIHATAEISRFAKDYERRKLHRKVRVLCLVLTFTGKNEAKATAVKNTWGKRCSRLIFLASKEDHHLGSIDLGVNETRSNLWRKVLKGLVHAHKKYGTEIDWLLKADDDTYVIMENLRQFLSQYNASIPLFFGYRFKPFQTNGYMSGGAGYVMSRDALKRFATGLNMSKFMSRPESYAPAEDVLVAQQLQKHNVIFGDSRDDMGRSRFFPLQMNYFLQPKKLAQVKWFPQWTYYSMKGGKDCCSNSTITCHYIKEKMIKAIEYLLYTRQPFPTGVVFKVTLHGYVINELVVVHINTPGILREQWGYNKRSGCNLVEQSLRQYREHEGAILRKK